MQVETGKTVSVSCVTVWEGKWCQDNFKGDAMKVRAVGTVTNKNGPSDEWNVKFPFTEGEANHTIWGFLLRVEHPAQVTPGTFLWDDPITRRIYAPQDEKRETKTPLRKSVNFKTNDARIRGILSTASLSNDIKIAQVADALKAMYSSASLDRMIRDYFVVSSGYKPSGNTVVERAKSMAMALVEGHVAWHAIADAEMRTNYQPPILDTDTFRSAQQQHEAKIKNELTKLRRENAELRASKRHKGPDGGTAATLLNRLDEEDETHQESGAPGLRHALAQLADDEADRATILDKYKLRGIAEVHLIKTTVLRRIMKGYGVSLMELRPSKNTLEYGQDGGKFVMTPEAFQRLLRSLLRITSVFFPQHREDIMDHFHEALDYLRTHTLQSVIDWTYAVRCQVPLGEWNGREATYPCDLDQ
eukprot:g48636.t1